MKTLYTSLSEIKSFNPCSSGYLSILKGQGKTIADDVKFSLVDCVKSNSFGDVCWLLSKRKVEISILVKAARLCADSVKHLKNNHTAAADDADAYADDAYAAYAYADAAYADADADAYADDAYAAYAAADADAAAYAAAYAAAAAADAADAADAAYADAADAAYAAREKQKELNKQFLLLAIQEYENSSVE